MTLKASLFIGSSKEGLDVARAIGYQLRDDVEVTIWNEGVFVPGQGSLETLVNALDRFDFAVIVLTPDDTVTVRDRVMLQPRDNLMFELGLFMGRLGRARTFAVCPDQTDMRLPSDLAGVTVVRYESDRQDANLRAAVSGTCIPIRDAVRDLGVSDTRGVQRLADTTTRVERGVREAVGVLLRSRIWETEVFRTYFGAILNAEEMKRLDHELAELRRVVGKQDDADT